MVCDKNGNKKSFKLCRCPCRWRCNCLIPRKKKSHPPFNSGIPIDVKRGMHPKLAISSDDAPPPGAYDPKPIKNKSTHVTDWKREEAVKEFSATMGGKLVDKYLIQRELMRSGLGPATHEIKQWPETDLEKSCAIKKRDFGFGGAPRFEKSHGGTRGFPGPGYNGKNHNPYHYLDENRFKSYSKTPTFEFDGFLPRFKNPSKSWSLACNRYNAQHPESLDKILNKQTGRRGPYDLFTGPRNSTSLVGYLSQPKSIETKNWPGKFATNFEMDFGGSNRRKGVWTNCPRFTKKPTVRSMLEDISLCYKNPDWPGPGFYDPVSPGGFATRGKHPPFNDGVKNARPLRPFDMRPGPATYNLEITDKKNIPGNGWTCAFKSKVERKIGPKIEEYNSF